MFFIGAAGGIIARGTRGTVIGAGVEIGITGQLRIETEQRMCPWEMPGSRATARHVDLARSAWWPLPAETFLTVTGHPGARAGGGAAGAAQGAITGFIARDLHFEKGAGGNA